MITAAGRVAIREMNNSVVIVDEHDHDKVIMKKEKEIHLTVFRTSFFFAGDGFTVYNANMELVFRVDSYSPDSRDTVLMNASGRCLLTVRQKRPSLHQRWEGFSGERTDGQKPMFSVHRSSIMGSSSMMVEVYGGGEHSEEYRIEGSPGHRCYTVIDVEKEVVAEIKRKVDASTHVELGKDVFHLILKPRCDATFAMGLVLVLDRINGDDILFDDDGDGGVDLARTGGGN